MNDVFINTQVLVKLDTNQNLAGATGTEIHYKKPDGTTGEWGANVDGQYLTYNTTINDLDQRGRWQFQAVASISGSLVKGNIATKIINKPLKTD